ncbi:hypothetical protein [uncultured Microbulbifer sp.]|uniref:hypothetical protein n=1 Tax=uncultured Microbulbifer sp. TaxID=348147 RepID=UPI002604300A|nr:hypothetical protein [uncultured Microbulbifer sp.]
MSQQVFNHTARNDRCRDDVVIVIRRADLGNFFYHRDHRLLEFGLRIFVAGSQCGAEFSETGEYSSTRAEILIAPNFALTGINLRNC